MNLKLKGKPAIVTGSSAGIGAAMLKVLAAEGASVIARGRSRERTEAVAQQVRAAGAKAEVVISDLSTDGGAAEVLRQVLAGGALDVLINNAGSYDPTTWDTVTSQDWIKSYESDVLSSVRMIQGLLPSMQERGWGRIMMIGSGSGRQPRLQAPDRHTSRHTACQPLRLNLKKMRKTGQSPTIYKQHLAGKALPWMLAAWVAAGAAAPALAQTAVATADRAPWSAPASVTVVQEEKTYHSASTELSGTLYLPQGGKTLGLVVVAHGASMPLRDHALYKHLKQMLPPLGVAVFTYDRRGSGKSGGDLQSSDYAQLADDAIAAAQMLKADSRIDPKHIDVWGFSLGGWLSLLAASRSPVISFAVSISAPVVTPDVQMIFASANILRVNGYPAADIAQAVTTRKTVDDYMRGSGDRNTVQRMLDVAKRKPWFKQIYMSGTLEDPATSRWHSEIEHDPLKTLDDVKVPALLLFGAADPWVPVATSVVRLKAVAAQHRNLDVAVIAGADHAMQLSVSPKAQMNPIGLKAQAPESVEYFGLLASWLTKQGIARTEIPVSLVSVARPIAERAGDVAAEGSPARPGEVAAAVDVADQAARQRGGKVQVAVLGTAHLREAPKTITPEAFGPLVARLAAFKPDLVAVESLSGAQCDYLRTYAFAYEDTAKTFCSDSSVARTQLKLDGAAVEREIEALLSMHRELTPAQRRRLSALFLAAGEPASAAVQWLRLPQGERITDVDLTPELRAQIDKKLSQRSEDTLIAIPLALKMGLERLYPVDDHTGDRATGPIDASVWQTDMTRIWKNPSADTRRSLQAQAQDRMVADGDVIGWYRWLNSAPAAQLVVAGDFAAAAADTGAQRTGRSYLAYWETRNLRMAANIREVVGRSKANRALLIVGASHKPYYERYLGMTSDIDVLAIDAVLQ